MVMGQKPVVLEDGVWMFFIYCCPTNAALRHSTMTIVSTSTPRSPIDEINAIIWLPSQLCENWCSQVVAMSCKSSIKMPKRSERCVGAEANIPCANQRYLSNANTWTPLQCLEMFNSIIKILEVLCGLCRGQEFGCSLVRRHSCLRNLQYVLWMIIQHLTYNYLLRTLGVLQQVFPISPIPRAITQISKWGFSIEPEPHSSSSIKYLIQ